MRLYSTREPKYSIKSQKARKVDNAITESLNNSKLSFLVFGPGKRLPEFHSHRAPVKSLIERLNQIAVFPEDVEVPSGSDLIAKRLADNPATKELYLMKKYDYTIVLLMGVGSISEYSIYLTKSEVAYKIRLYIADKHRRSGYLIAGPVKAFKDVYKQVYYFKNPAHLLVRVKKMVESMIVLKPLQS